MKGIRMTGLTEKSYNLVHTLRTTELKHANGFRMIQVFSFCIGMLSLLHKLGTVDIIANKLDSIHSNLHHTRRLLRDLHGHVKERQ